MRSPCTATESSPHFLQLKKVLRPSAAKDTLFSIKGHWSFFKLSRIIAFQSSFPQDFWQGGQGNSRRKNVVFSINVPGPLDLHRQKMKLEMHITAPGYEGPWPPLAAAQWLVSVGTKLPSFSYSPYFGPTIFFLSINTSFPLFNTVRFRMDKQRHIISLQIKISLKVLRA